nr:MAG TPA: hypothetical protein [Caudoviricetes sp.]
MHSQDILFIFATCSNRTCAQRYKKRARLANIKY